MFAILQKYEFSSKSQLNAQLTIFNASCLRYCKSTSFQANHNKNPQKYIGHVVVCDTAKVRVFKQITTPFRKYNFGLTLFAILQKYEFSSKSQLKALLMKRQTSCLRYCKSTSFQANHNRTPTNSALGLLFAILQKYEFSSKSQPFSLGEGEENSCLRYCKSTSFQANHNYIPRIIPELLVVCDTAKVRVFKQITTRCNNQLRHRVLFAILQKYEFSSKSQLSLFRCDTHLCCLRYCKSTSFQANHNYQTQIQ